MNRSWMFIPGDSDKKLGKAQGIGADALLLDLEDSVGEAHKADARARVYDYLAAHRGDSTCELWVRVNALDTPHTLADLVAVMFGTRYLGMLGGIVFLSHQVGSFLGVWMGGWLYDIYGSYDAVWWLGVALGLFAAVVHWPIREEPVQRPAAA